MCSRRASRTSSPPRWRRAAPRSSSSPGSGRSSSGRRSRHRGPTGGDWGPIRIRWPSISTTASCPKDWSRSSASALNPTCIWLRSRRATRCSPHWPTLLGWRRRSIPRADNASSRRWGIIRRPCLPISSGARRFPMHGPFGDRGGTRSGSRAGPPPGLPGGLGGSVGRSHAPPRARGVSHRGARPIARAARRRRGRCRRRRRRRRRCAACRAGNRTAAPGCASRACDGAAGTTR